MHAWRETHRRYAAARALRDPDAGTPCGTTPPGCPPAPRAVAAPRSASSRCHVRSSGVRPRLRQATSTRLPSLRARAWRLTSAPAGGTGSRSNRLAGMDERAVRGRTEDDIAPHRLGKRDFATTLDEREDAAAETRAHDARAETAFDAPRPLDERVNRGRRHLEIVAEALVRLLEEHSQLFEAALFERVDEGVHARYLGVDVAPALRDPSLGLAPAFVVGRVRERAMLARVDDRDRELVRKRHRLIFEGRAVQQQGVPAASQRRRELVHHAHVHAGSTLLRTLTRKRCLGAVELRTQAHRYRDQQGGRRAEAGARWNVRLDRHHLWRRAEVDADGAQVLEPAAHVAFDRPLPRFAPGDPRVPIDSSRQHHTAEVVDVLPDEVHSAGRTALPRPRTLGPRRHAAPRLCPLRAHRR